MSFATSIIEEHAAVSLYGYMPNIVFSVARIATAVVSSMEGSKLVYEYDVTIEVSGVGRKQYIKYRTGDSGMNCIMYLKPRHCRQSIRPKRNACSIH